MSTSAAQLYSVLNPASLPRSNDTLAKGITIAIGAPFDNPSIAMKYLRNLVLNINSDLEASFEDPLLAHLKRLMQPFQVLLSFSIYDRICRDLTGGGNMLSASSVEGLLGVDAALQGKCERPILNLNEEILKSIASLRDDLKAVELPENISRVLNLRVDQLDIALKHFELYGVTGMNDAMEALLGAVELYVPQKKKFKPAYSRLRGAVFSTLLIISGAIATTNSTVEEGVELIENITDGAKMLEDLRKTASKSGSEEE